jgi:hypothetical protein
MIAIADFAETLNKATNGAELNTDNIEVQVRNTQTNTTHVVGWTPRLTIEGAKLKRSPLTGPSAPIPESVIDEQRLKRIDDKMW